MKTQKPLTRLFSAVLVFAASALLISATPSPRPTPPIPDIPSDPVRASQYWLDGARIREAWSVTRGAGITIAVIDTGVGKGPAIFEGAVTGGTDVSGLGTPDGRTALGPLDADHGSRVASLAAGRGSADGTGMIGVAPEADLLSISLGFGATAPVPFNQQVSDAMIWAVDNGADVINLSFTTNTLDWDPSWDSAFQYAFDNDVVVVVAAGNRGSGTKSVGAPATIPGVLTVGGVDQHGMASQRASTQGITIAVSAPSERLLGVTADGLLVGWDGTSGAAPIVAGAVALVRAAHPDLDAANVINRIIQTAKPAEYASSVPDPLYGFGLLDVAAAIKNDVAHVDENPLGDLAEWVRVHRRAYAEPLPVPNVAPVEIPPLPAPEKPSAAGMPLIPNRQTLHYGTLPLIALTVPGILIGLGVTAAARRIRSARVQSALPPDD